MVGGRRGGATASLVTAALALLAALGVSSGLSAAGLLRSSARGSVAPRAGGGGRFFAPSPPPSRSWRLEATTTKTTMTPAGSSASSSMEKKDDFYWPLWFVLPLAPYRTRETVVEETIPGKIWSFDQIQGVLYVWVPIRMTVVKLKEGGLLVYAPVAPTKQVIRRMRELEAVHGEVKHIVLPTLGLEHKVYAGPFAGYFRRAEVWAMDGQFSFPVRLPLSFLGFGTRQVKKIPDNSADAPWRDDFDHAKLGPLESAGGTGAFGEVAFFHKDSGSLLVTDVLVKVQDPIPKVMNINERPLLFHARDGPLEKVQDSPQIRSKGWRRIQQFALLFNPAGINVLTFQEALFELAPKSPMKELGWGGLLPWTWSDDSASWKALKSGLQVAPILRCLILNREPERVLDWADRVSKWPIKRLLPCHLANNVPTSGSEVRKAFRFLEEGGNKAGGGFFSFGGGQRDLDLPDADLAFLREAEQGLVKAGTIGPAASLVKQRRR